MARVSVKNISPSAKTGDAAAAHQVDARGEEGDAEADLQLGRTEHGPPDGPGELCPTHAGGRPRRLSALRRPLSQVHNRLTVIFA